MYDEGPEHWDARFDTTDWMKAGGNLQSILFAQCLVESLLHSPLAKHFLAMRDYVHENGEVTTARAYTIHDYGCAMGDGTAVLQASFPCATVTGLDWSNKAVERARLRWPTVAFEYSDVQRTEATASVIVTSHTLEHTSDPAAIVQRLLPLCELLVVVVPPISPGNDGGHTGAQNTNDWVARVRPRPLWKAEFNSARFVDGIAYIEGSCVIVFQGML